MDVYYGEASLPRGGSGSPGRAADDGPSHFVPSEHSHGHGRLRFAAAYLCSAPHGSDGTLLHLFQLSAPDGAGHAAGHGAPRPLSAVLVDHPLPRSDTALASLAASSPGDGREATVDAVVRRCGRYSKATEIAVLPSDATPALLQLADPAAARRAGTSRGVIPTDLDAMLQRTSALDFVRVAAAALPAALRGGRPPLLLEACEGQDLGAATPQPLLVQRHLRPLPLLLAGGLTHDATRAMTEEHQRQLRGLYDDAAAARHAHTAELVELHRERDDLRQRVAALERDAVVAGREHREERRALRQQVAGIAEDLRRARDEATTLRLQRYGVDASPSTGGHRSVATLEDSVDSRAAAASAPLPALGSVSGASPGLVLDDPPPGRPVSTAVRESFQTPQSTPPQTTGQRQPSRYETALFGLSPQSLPRHDPAPYAAAAHSVPPLALGTSPPPRTPPLTGGGAPRGLGHDEGAVRPAEPSSAGRFVAQVRGRPPLQ